MFFFFQAEDGIRNHCVTGVQTCALPISRPRGDHPQDRARSRKRQRPAPPSRQPYLRLRARRHLRGESRRRSAAKARAGRNVLRAARRAARGLAQRQLGPPGQVPGHPDLRSDQAADGARVGARGLKKFILVAASLGAASPAAQFAAAQSAAYPSKPVHVILPFPPGGSVDTVARLVMPRVSERLGQQFLIENRSGASGNIGTEYVARAAPDGYTLMVNTIPFVANSHMYAKLPFDPLTDFAPISLLASSPSVLVVHPSLPARSVRELLELARSKPGVLNFATAGPGTNAHIAAELFNYLGKVKMVAIHYKGGGPALLSTVAGDTEIIVSGVSEATPFAAAGKLRALGITSLARSPAFPDIPTIAESGLPGYEFVTWHGLLAPKGTSGAIVALLNDSVKRTMAAPDQVKLFRQIGQDIVASTPEEFAAHLKKESAKCGRVIREQGMRAG